MSVQVTIYGASDDLVEVEGDIEGADEYDTYDKWEGALVAPDGSGLLITAEFVGRNGTDWQLFIGNWQDSYPAWPVVFGQRPDREGDPAIIVTVPDGTRLITDRKQLED